jgi:hypothetical protein
VANLSKKSVSLPRGTIVGQIEAIKTSDYTINIFDVTSETKTTKSSQTLPTDLDLTKTTLDAEQLEKLKQLLLENSDLFNKTLNEPGNASKVTHTIDTQDNRPINQPPYHAGPKEREVIQQQINEMLNSKVIQPSKSPWAAPVVLVKKKDNSVRFCVDYRKLNNITKKDVYPLPRIDDSLGALGRAKYFSCMDLTSGYWQIPMNEKDREKTAFVSHAGLYEFLVMPFGLCNAPATFQRYMDITFAGLKWNSCLVYLDDIIVFSPTFEQHLDDLKSVFERIRTSNLRIKASKCNFCCESLTYLGHKITPSGIQPDPKKISAIKEIQIPKTKSQLLSFLGISGYYRRFVYNFAKLAFPLFHLTHDNEEFVWTESHTLAFERLKEILISSPLLNHPNFDHPFIIRTDASDEGIGAVLFQIIDGRERVIMYISRTLQLSERKWSIREKEALAIIWSCEQFRPYIIGTRFLVETDHESLKWLMDAKSPARLVRWALRLSEFDFEIRYKKGKENQVADGLSRLPEPNTEAESENLGLENYVLVHELKEELNGYDFALEQRKDNFLRGILRDLFQETNNKKHLEKFEIEDSKLVYRISADRTALVVPEHLVEVILKSYHCDKPLSHIGRDKLYALLKTRFYWPSMYDDIKRWVKACLNCAKVKPHQPKLNGLLQPFKASSPFEIVGIDILGPFKTTKSRSKYVLVCICYFTNWVEACPLKTIEAEEVAIAFYKLIITRHGCPFKVLTDQGTQFSSRLFQSFCDQFGLKKLQCSPKHPQTNGKAERFIRFLTNALATIVSKDQSDWDTLIDDCLFAYRVTINHTIQETPFFLLYGREAILPNDMLFGAIRPNDFSQNEIDNEFGYKMRLLTRLKNCYEEIELRRDKAINYYKKNYDSTHKDISFNVNDLVMVYWPIPKKGFSQKLLPKWDGPFEIVARLGKVTYRVKDSKRTLVAHVQRLRKYEPF